MEGGVEVLAVVAGLAAACVVVEVVSWLALLELIAEIDVFEWLSWLWLGRVGL